MMNRLEAAARQALEALDKIATHVGQYDLPGMPNHITTLATLHRDALREALAEQPDYSICPACGGMSANPIVPVACTYGDGGYACCEGGPCAADMHNASLSDRHMDAVKPFTADVMRIMRDAGMTFHLGLPHDKVIEQITRVVDLAYAEASIKAAVVFSAPTQQPLTDEQKAVLLECRNQAMKWAGQAGIPECAAFGEVAQDLDWLCGQLGIAENQKGGAA